MIKALVLAAVIVFPAWTHDRGFGAGPADVCYFEDCSFRTPKDSGVRRISSDDEVFDTTPNLFVFSVSQWFWHSDIYKGCTASADNSGFAVNRLQSRNFHFPDVAKIKSYSGLIEKCFAGVVPVFLKVT